MYPVSCKKTKNKSMVWKYNVTIVWSQNICMYIFLVLIKNVTNIFLNVEILITELICIKFYVCIPALCCTLLIMLILCCPAPFKIHFLLYSLVFLLHLFFFISSTSTDACQGLYSNLLMSTTFLCLFFAICIHALHFYNDAASG